MTRVEHCSQLNSTPSEVGTNSLAGHACTHAFIVQLRHMSEFTVMCGCSATRNSTLAIRSSKLGPEYRVYGVIRTSSIRPVAHQIAQPDAKPLALGVHPAA
jgi:hypothetical protein